jgi:hypothetical protein
MELNDSLQKIQERAFNIFICVSYLLIFATAFGFSKYAPQYLSDMDYYVKIYICLFLIIRFNPFRTIKFTNLDRKIAFSAGLFILTTTVLAQYFIKISKTTKNYLESKIKQY